MFKPNAQFVRHALITFGAIATATILREEIDRAFGEPIQYTTFYLAVMVSVLYCGLYWGLTSVVLSTIAASYWLPPLPRSNGESNDIVAKSLFLIVSTLIVWLSHRMRQHQQRAEQAAAERHELLLREQAARREAERLNHAKDDFLATVSHELRTPLQSILGWVSLMRDFEVDAEETGVAIASIERSVRVQSQLINDLLDLSRIVMGKIRLDAHPVSLGDVVEAAVQTVYPAAQAKGVRLDVRCGGFSCVLGDAERLQQIAWNLLSNAIKFTPAGGTVRAIVSQHENQVTLEVSDTGEGIDPDFLAHVFERFRQEEGGRPREGLGLGLAIVKELAELHGGTIRVHSDGHGKGTAFTVVLPKHRPVAVSGDANVAPAVPPATKSRLAGKQVLVVDDDPEARRLIKTVLRFHGVDVVTADSAKRATELLATCHPDIVTCDLDMPEVDGFQFVHDLRRHHPRHPLPARRGPHGIGHGGGPPTNAGERLSRASCEAYRTG